MSEQTLPRIAVSLAQAAEILGVSKVTLWHWKRAGKLNVVVVSPRIIRVRMEEIERLLGGQA
jgi:predicted site-specific integrase-resolvase